MPLKHLKKYRFFYSYLLVGIFIALFVYYFKRHQQEFKALSIISYGYLIAITLLVFSFKIILALKFKTMLDFFGLKLKAREWFGLHCISSMVNYLLPARAGIVTQAVYLKQIHQFEYAKFATYLTGFLIFIFAMNSFAGVLFLLLYYFMKGIFLPGLFLFFFTTSVLSSILIFLIPHLHKLNLRWELFNRIVAGFKFFKEKRFLIWRLSLLHFADIIITGLRLFLAYRALGISVDILPAFMVGLFASISSILALTPADLGVREASIAFSSIMIGKNVSVGIMASLIDRAAGAMVTFIFGLIYMHILMPMKRK